MSDQSPVAAIINPISTPSPEILLFYQTNLTSQIALDHRTIGQGQDTIFQDNGCVKGTLLAAPATWQAVQHDGSVSVYGLTTPDSSLGLPAGTTVVSQIVPVYNPVALTSSSSHTALTTYTALAVASDGLKTDYIFFLQDSSNAQTGTPPAVIQIKLSYDSPTPQSLENVIPQTSTKLAAFYDSQTASPTLLYQESLSGRVFWIDTLDQARTRKLVVAQFTTMIANKELQAAPIEPDTIPVENSPLVAVVANVTSSTSDTEGSVTTAPVVFLYYFTRDDVVNLYCTYRIGSTWKEGIKVPSQPAMDKNTSIAVTTDNTNNYIFFQAEGETQFQPFFTDPIAPYLETQGSNLELADEDYVSMIKTYDS